jgi:thiosulfate reductase cytochrome b subunit
LVLLNALLPLQVLTGALIWTSSRWPWLIDAVGGLSVIAPLHNFGSWLLMTFLVVHLYLITTGHSLTSNLSAMIDGYDEIEVPSGVAPSHEGGHHA